MNTTVNFDHTYDLYKYINKAMLAYLNQGNIKTVQAKKEFDKENLRLCRLLPVKNEEDLTFLKYLVSRYLNVKVLYKSEPISCIIDYNFITN